jgi:hypothetical protein
MLLAVRSTAGPRSLPCRLAGPVMGDQIYLTCMNLGPVLSADLDAGPSMTLSASQANN